MTEPLGVSVLLAVRENEPFALRCVRFLLDMQEADELVEGTSIHRNGRGLSKPHAEMLAARAPETMDATTLSRIASEYAHTQLTQGVKSGQLRLPATSVREQEDGDAPVSKRRRRAKILQSDDEEDEGGDEEDVDEENGVISLDEYGVHADGVVMPSARLVARVRRIVDETRARGISGRSIPWRVRRAVNEEDGWRGTNVSSRVVDAALYQVMPGVDMFTVAPKTVVRIFWVSEHRWATAEVVRVRRGSDTSNVVELYFPDEEIEGTVTGADTLYAYELK